MHLSRVCVLPRLWDYLIVHCKLELYVMHRMFVLVVCWSNCLTTLGILLNIIASVCHKLNVIIQLPIASLLRFGKHWNVGATIWLGASLLSWLTMLHLCIWLPLLVCIAVMCDGLNFCHNLISKLCMCAAKTMWLQTRCPAYLVVNFWRSLNFVVCVVLSVSCIVPTCLRK